MKRRRGLGVIRQTLHSRVLYLSTPYPASASLSPIDFYITYLRFVSESCPSISFFAVSSPFSGGFVEYRAGTRSGGGRWGERVGRREDGRKSGEKRGEEAEKEEDGQ